MYVCACYDDVEKEVDEHDWAEPGPNPGCAKALGSKYQHNDGNGDANDCVCNQPMSGCQTWSAAGVQLSSSAACCRQRL